MSAATTLFVPADQCINKVHLVQVVVGWSTFLKKVGLLPSVFSCKSNVSAWHSGNRVGVEIFLLNTPPLLTPILLLRQEQYCRSQGSFSQYPQNRELLDTLCGFINFLFQLSLIPSNIPVSTINFSIHVCQFFKIQYKQMLCCDGFRELLTFIRWKQQNKSTCNCNITIKLRPGNICCNQLVKQLLPF